MVMDFAMDSGTRLVPAEPITYTASGDDDWSEIYDRDV